MLYYSTENGNPTGRASHYYQSRGKVKAICEEQNAKAESLGIKARYKVMSCQSQGIDPKEVRQ